MEIGSLLLGIALLLAVALYVGRPFLQGVRGRRESLSEREALQEQKDALLEQIRTLDFERETGKMPDDEYARQRTRLLHEAAAVLKALDNLGPTAAANAGAEVGGAGEDIEAAVAALRRAPDATAPPAVPGPGPAYSAGHDTQIEAAVQSLRTGQREPAPTNGAGSGGFCPQCGSPRDAADKFCAYCGTRFA